jgi:hypothetical protein
MLIVELPAVVRLSERGEGDSGIRLVGSSDHLNMKGVSSQSRVNFAISVWRKATHYGLALQGAGHLAQGGAKPMSPRQDGSLTIGGRYWSISAGFKRPRARGGGGSRYGMARPATRCTHIGSRVHVPQRPDRGGWCMSGRERGPDRMVGVDLSPKGPARECAR